jgi:UDP-N-acetylmuramoyl-tripeptide--D-alanyl-D-alanine ligase
MFTIAEIAAATGGTIIGRDDGWVTGVSTDSRTIRAGDLFVPLAGPRFDGHDYIPDVAARGVTVVLSGIAWATSHLFPAGVTAVVVPDPLRALGDLAALYRGRYTLPVVGVTGSNGKTTTKEMIASILTLTGPGLKTSGNLNNLIGLPQMLFQLIPGMRWAVLEMGMSEPGEIDRLAEIARPVVGVITNAFPAHLESMGSVENVAAAKGELFMRLPPGGTAIYNADDPLVAALPSPAGVVRHSFGRNGGDVTATEVVSLGLDGTGFFLNLAGGSIPVRLHVCGRHLLANALAAAAAAEVLGVDKGTIRAGLERFRPGDRRFTVEQVGHFTLIDDSYNANPASMAAALATLVEVKGKGRVLLALGDMMELGADTELLHRQLGEQAGKVAWRLYLLGAMAPIVAAGALSAGLDQSAIIIGGTHDEIAADILGEADPGDLVLVKGSRGMGMDRVATLLRKKTSRRKEA